MVLYVVVHAETGAFRSCHEYRKAADEVVELWLAYPNGPGPRTGVPYRVVEYVPRDNEPAGRQPGDD